MDEARENNQAAYRRLKATITETFPPGRLVAIHEGQIVADAADFDVLKAALRALGKNPRDVLVVQAGVEYPETVVILGVETAPGRKDDTAKQSV